jgi:RNA methyltransferase, TrmH family
MAIRLGIHADRLNAVRRLQTTKGRRESGQFAFEGATLLGEAHRTGTRVEELFVTEDAYDSQACVRDFEASGVPTFIVQPRSAAKISDLDTPPGIVAVARAAFVALEALLSQDGIALVLGDVSDPGNVGTLMRSAEAFGATGIALGRLGADPHHPKVVRAAMGAIFRLRIALADPDELSKAAASEGCTLLGLSADGTPVAGFAWPARCALVVGGERHGLGRWQMACEQNLAIPMRGGAESLNAAVAGSIALYEATKGAVRRYP